MSSDGWSTAEMSTLFVPDSFGGFLSAPEASALLEDALAGHGVFLDTHPMADGGEGLVDVLAAHGTIELHGFEVPGADGEEVFATAARRAGSWWIESAEVIGLHQTQPGWSPMKGSSWGLGILMQRLAQRAQGPMLIGLGGTATMDGGLGMLQALGMTALDVHGAPLPSPATAADLAQVDKLVGTAQLPLGLFRVVADVRTPITAAAQVFGPQKGFATSQIETLSSAIQNWTRVLQEHRQAQGRTPLSEELSGGGAAGGIGFALASAVSASIADGAAMIGRLTGLEDAIRSAKTVIIGEGRLDSTSFDGKVAGHVTALARHHKRRVIALVGTQADGQYPVDHIVEIGGMTEADFRGAAAKVASLL